MSGGRIYVDDVGTLIYADACSDISAATDQNIKVLKPNSAAEVTWASSVYTETLSSYLAATGNSRDNPDFSSLDLTDSVSRRLRYVTTSGDLNVHGPYKSQSYIVMPAWRGRGGTFEIPVVADFD